MLADGQDVTLVEGAQGGFHVWMQYAVRGLPAGTVTLERSAHRVSDGAVVLVYRGDVDLGAPRCRRLVDGAGAHPDVHVPDADRHLDRRRAHRLHAAPRRRRRCGAGARRHHARAALSRRASATSARASAPVEEEPMLRRLLATAAVAAVAAHAPDARACGCFAQPSTATPVVQAGERILFAHEGDKVIAYIQIQYQGAADEFGWIVPLPSVPTLEVGTDELFTMLDSATLPQYQLCARSNSAAAARSATPTARAAAAASAPPAPRRRQRSPTRALPRPSTWARRATSSSRRRASAPTTTRCSRPTTRAPCCSGSPTTATSSPPAPTAASRRTSIRAPTSWRSSCAAAPPPATSRRSCCATPRICR